MTWTTSADPMVLTEYEAELALEIELGNFAAAFTEQRPETRRY